MNTVLRLVKAAAGLVILAMFVLALVALFSNAQPATQSQFSPPATTTPPVSQLPTPTSPKPYPTSPPSPTPPPVPTPLPTPVVTPIPVASPPFIPEVVGKTQQPFWIIYWQGDEVWRIDDQGKDRQLLVDTYKSLGQWLTDIPDPYKDSDCCWIGPRVVVSPDGQQLALVVVDKLTGTSGDRFTFSIYIFDVATDHLKLVSEGQFPTWSPDGKRIAFARNPDPGVATDGGLWIADLVTGQVYELIKGDPDKPSLQVRYWAWSPDSQRIAYRFGEGIVDQTEIWIKSIADSSTDYLLPNTSDATFYSFFSWMPDGEHLLCYTEDWEAPEHPLVLWAVTIQTGERKRLDYGFVGGGSKWSADGKWLLINAARVYERTDAPYGLWLLSADGLQLLRLTSAPPEDMGGFWSPDGTRLVFQREGVGLVTLSLQTGNVIPLYPNLGDGTGNNYAMGGIK
jgi:dipeptidyl aminopeptidase/acylaminoacyl peptidase